MPWSDYGFYDPGDITQSLQFDLQAQPDFTSQHDFGATEPTMFGNDFGDTGGSASSSGHSLNATGGIDSIG